MNKKELIRIGRHLFGNRWKTHLANAIGVRRETVSRWSNGKQDISFTAAKAISLLYKQHPITLCERRYNAKGDSVEIGDATLIHGDSRKIIRQIDQSINVLLTDPVWPKPLMCLAGSENPEHLLIDVINSAASNLRNLKRIIIQMRCDSDPRILVSIPPQFPFLRSSWLPYAIPSRKGRVLISGDIGYIFGKPPQSREGNRILPGEIHRDYCPLAQTQRMEKNKIQHPCPRNLEHVEWLIEKFTEPTDTILDPLMGSGTTGIASLKRGRKFVGIEIERKYWLEAKRRIKHEWGFLTKIEENRIS